MYAYIYMAYRAAITFQGGTIAPSCHIKIAHDCTA